MSARETGRNKRRRRRGRSDDGVSPDYSKQRSFWRRNSSGEPDESSWSVWCRVRASTSVEGPRQTPLEPLPANLADENIFFPSRTLWQTSNRLVHRAENPNERLAGPAARTLLLDCLSEGVGLRAANRDRAGGFQPPFLIRGASLEQSRSAGLHLDLWCRNRGGPEGTSGVQGRRGRLPRAPVKELHVFDRGHSTVENLLSCRASPSGHVQTLRSRIRLARSFRSFGTATSSSSRTIVRPLITRVLDSRSLTRCGCNAADATRKHYDLRLQLDGTMFSWAIPRGFDPPYDGVRLAIETFPHGMSYALYEGLATHGRSHAGVWDVGSYEASNRL